MKKKPYKKVYIGWMESKPSWETFSYYKCKKLYFDIITSKQLVTKDKQYRITIEEVSK